MRREFVLTDEQLDMIRTASRPVPMIALQCGPPPSVYEKAEAAWRHVAEQLGFVWDTAEPVPHRNDDHYITAEAK